MTKSPETAQASMPALAELDPQHVTTRNMGYYSALVTLGKPSVSASELTVAADELRQHLTGSWSITPQARSTGFVLLLEFHDGDIRAPQRNQLMELVDPKFRAHADVVARWHRDKDGKHVGTIVTMTVDDGKTNVVSKATLEAIDGVLRATPKYSENRITFSLENPGTADVDEVTKRVADALAVHIDRPVAVTDPKSDLALLPAFDADESAS